jgi:acyl-CoA reductase-like NAD-dependent aldehyde dehydrogenase
MGKKAVKRSTAAKKAAAKKKASKGPANRKEVREQIAGLVAANVAEMTTAMIEEANKGCLPQYKYLLEVSAVYPASAAEENEAEDSNVLAKILLERLHLPNTLESEAEENDESKPGALAGETVSVE